MPHPTGSGTLPVFERQFGSWRIVIDRDAFSQSDISQIYDRCARSWKKRLSLFGTTETYGSAWDAFFDLTSGTRAQRQLRVLDCGIGDGAFSSAFASRYPGELDLHGVDLSAGMLDQARTNLSASGIHPTLWQADCRDLPFETETFDIVMAAHVIEHLPDPQSALSEMFRVLKPGGRAAFAITRNSPLGRLIQFSWRTQTFSFRNVSELLLNAKFSAAQELPIATSHLQNQLSLFCVAQKADAIAASATNCHEEI